MASKIQARQNARENRKERVKRAEMLAAIPLCGKCRKSLASHAGGKPCP